MTMPKIRKVLVARMGEIASGEVRAFRYGFQGGLLYNDAGVLKAYLNSCTHAGGRLEVVSGTRLRCLVHGAEFDAATGMRCLGQAPEGSRLMSIPLEIEQDMIFAVYEIKE